MEEEERIRLRNTIPRERRSHQITWFFVLQLAGILLAGNIAPPSQQAGWFFVLCWVATCVAWFASKQMAGLTKEDGERS